MTILTFIYISQIFKEAFLCSPSIIRAIYEFVEHNMEKLIESSERL